MKRKLFIIGVLFSFIFNVIFIIHLLSYKHSGSDNTAPAFLLNDSQKKKIEEESSGLLNENVKLENGLERCRQDLYNLLNSKETDRKEIEKCITTINDIQKKIQMNTVEQLLIYKKHMTDEQCKCFLKEFGENMNITHKCDENSSCNSE